MNTQSFKTFMATHCQSFQEFEDLASYLRFLDYATARIRVNSVARLNGNWFLTYEVQS